MRIRPVPASMDSNGGYCSRCGKWHVLPWQAAWQACQQLMEDLYQHGRIDCILQSEHLHPAGQPETSDTPDSTPTPDMRCSTAPLFRDGCGKMLGLLLCRDQHGKIHRLLAFSGMFNGLWQVHGWAGPVFDLQAFTRLHLPVEKEIQALGAQIEQLPHNAPARAMLRQQRRELSRENMRAIHELYTLGNFRGDTKPLSSFFPLASGPPSGAGDCCAPKLLHQAQTLGLRPLSMAEFYWGSSTATTSRKHGERYPPCASKCQPILGFQLCGL